jgi:hypothetical protein
MRSQISASNVTPLHQSDRPQTERTDVIKILELPDGLTTPQIDKLSSQGGG